MGYLVLLLIAVAGFWYFVKTLAEMGKTGNKENRNQENKARRHDSKEVLELKRRTQAMAEKQGVVITGWGDVKVDEHGQAYIECFTHIPDGKEGQYVDAVNKEFGDKVSDIVITKDDDEEEETETRLRTMMSTRDKD